MVTLIKNMRAEGEWLNQIVGKALFRIVNNIDNYVELGDSSKTNWKFDRMAISVVYVTPENRGVESYEEFDCVDARKVFEMIAVLPLPFTQYISHVEFKLLGNICLSIAYSYETGCICLKASTGLDETKDLHIFSPYGYKEMRELFMKHRIPKYTTCFALEAKVLQHEANPSATAFIWTTNPDTDETDLDTVDEMNYVFNSIYLNECTEDTKPIPLLEQCYATYLRIHNIKEMRKDAYIPEFLAWLFLWTEYTKVDLNSTQVLPILLSKIASTFPNSVTGESLLNALIISGLNGEKLMIRAGLATRG